MTEVPTVYASNRLEKLAEALGKKLFQKGSDPFSKHIVLLPHYNCKHYLQAFFARNGEWGICMGITCKTLLEGLLQLQASNKRFPSRLALTFALEQELCQLPDFSQDPEKILWTSTELSSVFYDYGVSESSGLVSWLNQEGWLQDLWKQIFNGKTGWSSLHDLVRASSKEKQENIQVHVFGFSHIPSPVYEFLRECNCSIYFLSPCEMFWEDVCSDKERLFLEKQMKGAKVSLQVQEQLCFYLKEAHPLLGNWGRVGREFLRLLGMEECYLEENYVVPEGDFALAWLQRSLLNGGALEEKYPLQSVDRSLLWFSASSKLRELEGLLETLQGFMQENVSITPKDVLVFCPNLASYLPYIHTVFGVNGSPFSYSVHGITLQGQEEKAIKELFALGCSRMERETVLSFLSCPSVYKKWGFSQEELEKIRKWSEQANVLWGLDLDHKQCCLGLTQPCKDDNSDCFVGGGTWKEGMDRLLMGLVMDTRGGLSVGGWEQPLGIVESTEAEVLGRFLSFLYALKKDMKPLYKNETKLREEWIFLVKEWLSTYLSPSEETRRLERALHSLEEELTSWKQKASISFTSFRRALDAYFVQRKESFQSSHIEAIKFLPLEEGSTYPAKVVCVLGCDAESIPIKDKRSSLDGMTHKQSPSCGDRSRYLFLEVVLQAREILLFSYLRVSAQDHKPMSPSMLVEDVFGYLDEHTYLIDNPKKPSELFTKHHPEIPFSHHYFHPGKQERVYSSHLVKKALSFYKKEKDYLPPFFPSWHEQSRKKELKIYPSKVSIKQLDSFIKHPIRHYFQEVLGLYFPFDPPKDREFFLSPLMNFQIIQQGKCAKLKKVLQIARATGEIPASFLGEIGAQEIEKQMAAWEEDFLRFQIKEQDVYRVEFISGLKTIEVYSGKVLCPAPVYHGVIIEGVISPVSPKGFLWFDGKGKKDKYPLLWPSYLLFLLVAEELHWSTDCLLIGEGKTFLSLQKQEANVFLAKYIRLYLDCLEDPCPIQLSWFSSLLAPTEEELHKKMGESFKGTFTDSYEAWIEHRDPELSATYIHKIWHERWQDTFSPLMIKPEKTKDESDG